MADDQPSKSPLMKKSEEYEFRFRAFFEQSSLPLMIFDLQGNPLEVNSAWEELYQVSKEDLVGYNILTDGSTEAMGLRPYLDRALRGESVVVPPFFNDPASHPGSRSGRARWLEAIFTPIKGQDGVVRELAVILKDVTERFEAQKILGALESKFRVAADSLALAVRVGKVGIWEWLLKENVVNWDETTEFIYGYEKGTFSRSTEAYTSHLHPEDAERCWVIVQEAINNRQWYTMDHRIIRKDGAVRWVHGSGMPFFDDKGELVRVLGTAIDITERKDQEEDQRLLVRISETLSVSFSYIDNIRTTVELLKDLFPGVEIILNDRLRERSVIRTGAPSGHSITLQLGKGDAGWGEIRFSLGAERATLRQERLANEIADRITHTLERSALYHASLEAIRARDEFLSIASHELKTPLQSLLLQNEIRSRSAPKDEALIQSLGPNYFRSLEIDRRQLHRINRLIEDMLDITRIRNSKLSLMKERFDLVTLVREVGERLAPQLELATCKFSLEAPGELFITADSFRIEQVIVNLITNAIKYGAGSPVRVVIEDSSGTAIVTVSDEGPGIRLEDQERIFHRFERAHGGGSISGLGLGLYISRTILELHGGTIAVSSAPGSGASFVIRLPG